MTATLLAIIPAPSPHDSGVRDIATLSGRFAYVTTCLTPAWGVLSGPGHEALRGGHVVLAAFTLAIGVVQGLSSLFLDDGSVSLLSLLIPFAGGGFARQFVVKPDGQRNLNCLPVPVQ